MDGIAHGQCLGGTDYFDLMTVELRALRFRHDRKATLHNCLWVGEFDRVLREKKTGSLRLILFACAAE